MLTYMQEYTHEHTQIRTKRSVGYNRWADVHSYTFVQFFYRFTKVKVQKDRTSQEHRKEEMERQTRWPTEAEK